LQGECEGLDVEFQEVECYNCRGKGDIARDCDFERKLEEIELV